MDRETFQPLEGASFGTQARLGGADAEAIVASFRQAAGLLRSQLTAAGGFAIKSSKRLRNIGRLARCKTERQ